MVPGYHIQGFPGLLKHHTYIEVGISSKKFDHMNMKLSIIGGGGGGQPDFSDPDFGKINFHIGEYWERVFRQYLPP